MRNDVISVSLEAYIENGDTPFVLGFARAQQTVDVLVACTRLGYDSRLA
jgi:hypothetical protein